MQGLREGEEFATKMINQALMELNFSPIESIFQDENTPSVIKYREIFLEELGALTEEIEPSASLKNTVLNFREIDGIISVQIPVDFISFDRIEKKTILDTGETVFTTIDDIYPYYSSKRLQLRLDYCTDYVERGNISNTEFFTNCQLWYKGLPLKGNDVLPNFKRALVYSIKYRLMSTYDPNILISERERAIGLAKVSEGNLRNAKLDFKNRSCRPRVPFSGDWSI